MFSYSQKNSKFKITLDSPGHSIRRLTQVPSARGRNFDIRADPATQPGTESGHKFSWNSYSEFGLHSVRAILEDSAQHSSAYPRFNLPHSTRFEYDFFPRTLVQALGEPLALTSANVSSERSTLNVDEFVSLWPLLDLVVDGGTLCQGAEEQQRRGSTVIDLSQRGTFSVARAGW